MEQIKRFTDTMVKNIRPSEKLGEYSEGGGFCLRVTPKGKKSWVYSYKFNGKSKRFTVGYYPALSVAEARKAVVDAGLLKDNGIDPMQEKKNKDIKAKQEKQRELQTIEWLANDFYARYIANNRKAPQQIRQQIDADIVPLLGQFNIEEITTRQITLALEKIVDRGAPVHANKVLSTIKQMFTYAVSKGITERNPALLIKAKNIGGVEPPRNRYLSYEEIKSVWAYFGDNSKHGTHPATIVALKILLLTGARTGSLIKARFDEIDFEGSLWTIPPEHLKLKLTEAHKPHKVHLSKLVKQLFLELRDLSGGNFVLPGRDGRGPANDKLFSRFVARTRGKVGGIEEHFNVHDFRATFSTHLAGLGVAPHISELCLGHKLPAIMATYNKHEYLPERKTALELWSDKIEMLVKNDNVVMLESKISC